MIDIFKEDDKNLLVNVNLKDANMGYAEEFKAELVQLFDKHKKRLIINLENVEYIDSSFLGALVSVLKYVISHQSDIALVGMRKDVATLFGLIRLDKVFKIYSNFDEALNQ